MAFHKAITQGATPKVLLNVMNEYGDCCRSHGIPREVLEAQVNCLGLPIRFIESTWKDYETRFVDKLKSLKDEFGFTHAVYGDIDIASHHAWEEKVSNSAGLEALLPIWQGDRRGLVLEMISLGIKALIVSCQQPYADQILGKVIDKDLLQTFEALGIDACGENGEYHTLVINGPLHKHPLHIKAGDIQIHNNYAFLKLTLKEDPYETSITI